jgi:UDP-2-acetamido-3-amino-2,3-dideoxy-glucuronate N-acetyltransferase
MNYFKHKTAEIDMHVTVGIGTKIWHHTHIREHAVIGKECVIGQNVYIDEGVIIGNYCRIQNNCSIYRTTKIENYVFIGPHVIFANDKLPRSFNHDDKPTTEKDWVSGTILVGEGASIGAGSIILPNVIIGEYAFIGAGSIVTKNVKPYDLIYGNPAISHGKVNKYGERIS